MSMKVDNIFGLKAIPQSTRNELDARTSTIIGKWHAARKPWAHMMSLAETCNTKGRFGMENGEIRLVGDGYIANLARPKPTIESISVKKQGELGTTKRTTVTIKAFTDEQLNEIAKCYFVPGMSIRVQWGWNMDSNSKNAPAPFTSVRTDIVAAQIIDNRIAECAVVDGLQGRLVNYSTTLDNDNVWTITLEIVSAGTMMGDVKASNVGGCVCEVKAEADPEKPDSKAKEVNIKVSNLKATLVDLIDDAKNKDNMKGYGPKASAEVYKIIYNGYDRDENGKEETSGPWYTFGMSDGVSAQPTTFMSLGALQGILTHTTQNKRGGKPADFELNSDGITISAPKINNIKLFCSDPRIAYIPGGALELGTGVVSRGAGQQVTYNPPPSAFDENGNIIFDNILINVTHCNKLLAQFEKGDDNLLDFYLKVLESINSACGSPWEFDLIDTSNELPKPEAPVRLSVVDTKKTGKANQIYTIKAKAAKSCVRSLNINLKLTEAMKTQALYSGNVAAPNTTAPCNDRFAAFTRISGRNLALPAGDSKGEATCTKNSTKCNKNEEKPSFEDILENLKNDPGATDETVEAARGQLIQLIGEAKKDLCKGSLIPLEFSVVLDGIGGFKFGQTATCDRFPPDYAKYFDYQVKEVEHTINVDDWSTTVNFITRLRA